MNRRKILLGLMASAALTVSGLSAAYAASIPAYITAAVADPARPAADTARDEFRMPAEIMAFAGVKPGSKVGEILPARGYFTRIFSKIVGPTGKVYLIITTQMPDRAVDVSTPLITDPAYPNLVMLHQPDTALAPPESLDIVFTAQNYHDMHNAGYGTDPAALTASIYKALKPGGVYVIEDHAGLPGTGLTETNTLHRIDPAVVKAEVTKAGFKFDGESLVLHRPEDPKTAKVFELHDKTDQFVYRFKKPK
jgi:predicted methyltransferase